MSAPSSLGISPVSSPASVKSRALSTEIVTPRTKIRQLLATVDSSDDNEDELTKPSGVPKRGLSFAARLNKAGRDDEASDEDWGMEEEGEAWKPRGRIAARMMGTVKADAEPDDTHSKKAASSLVLSQRSNSVVTPMSHRKEKNSAGLVDINTSSLQTQKGYEKAGSSESTIGLEDKRVRSRSSTPNTTSPSRFQQSLSNSQVSQDVLGIESNANVSSDNDHRSTVRKRMEEMIARKRAERQEEGDRVGKKRSLQRHKNNTCKHIRLPVVHESDSGDDNNGRKLTQQAKPTRKASKKALEEMHKETQRISRNQQLTHRIMTKKRITKDDLFARFAFKPHQTPEVTTSHRQSESKAPSSPNISSEDGKLGQKDTPPSSPPSSQSSTKDTRRKGEAEAENVAAGKGVDNAGDATTQQQGTASKQAEKGKGLGIETDITNDISNNVEAYAARVSRFSEDVRTKSLQKNKDDNDDDLEIVRHKPTSLSMFDQIPKKKRNEPRTLHMLRRLARIEAPNTHSTDTNKPSMNAAQLRASLQERARCQAWSERKERIEDLRAKGIIVQTEEERQKEMLEIENLLEKAREHDRVLSKKERKESKNDNDTDDGEENFSYSSDEEDEDWNGDDEGETSDLDEKEVDDEEEVDDKENANDVDDDSCEAASERNEMPKDANGIVRVESKDNLESTGEKDYSDTEDDTYKGTHLIKASKTRNKRIIDDDEEKDGTQEPHKNVPSDPQASTPNPSQAAVPSALPLPLGLTQAFAGSVESTSSQMQADCSAINQNIGNFRVFPEQMPAPPLLLHAESSEKLETLVESSQNPRKDQVNHTYEVNIQELDLPLTQLLNGQRSQAGEIPDPTPIKDIKALRLAENEIHDVPSSIETVIAPVPESPLKKPRRLVKRREESIRIFEDPNSDDDMKSITSDADRKKSDDAFSVMKRLAERAKAKERFDKKRSEAKEMFEEQAVESEDEYAGVGGASDDESGAEADEEMKDMIDEAEVEVDERKIAAYFANEERAEDEKRIEKLLKDVTKGGLRKKRTAEFDLSDSDDEIEAKKRRKRNEFARMRKALLEDENVGKIAEDPKKLAFFRSLEDQDEHKESDALVKAAPFVKDSQISTASASFVHPSTVTHATVKANETTNSKNSHEDRRPYYERRTRPSENKKPASLSEIRQTLSFVVDDPHIVPDSQLSDTDDVLNAAIHNSEEQAGKHFVDRISLSRSSTCASDCSSRLAFHTTDSAASSGTRVPSLLRRATAGMEIDGTKTKSSAAKAKESETIRRGGSKKSSINYQVREAERRSLLEAADKQKKAGMKSVVKSRRSVLSIINAATAFE